MFLRRRSIVNASDEDLVRLLREGHRSALADLWDRYAQLLYGVGMKYLKDPEQSKDEVVELFAGLKELVQKHEVKAFRPWLHTVMRNRCLQALRKVRPTTELPSELLRATEDHDNSEAMIHEATLQALEQAIEQLAPDQRACITAFHLERYTYQEVAERTGFAVEQVRSHLQNGRRNLRIILQRTPYHGNQHHESRNA